MKNNEVMAENPFQNSGVTMALVAVSARHSSRTKHRSGILSYSFDLNYIAPLKTANMPPITLVNAWPS